MAGGPFQWLTGSTSFNVAGLAIASDERIEAYLLYMKRGVDPEGTAEIVSLRSFVEDAGARLKHLLSRLRAQGMRTFRLPKVHPAEISKELLATLGFRPAGGHPLYAVRARSARQGAIALRPRPEYVSRWRYDASFTRHKRRFSEADPVSL